MRADTEVNRHLRRAILPSGRAGLTDGQLLSAYVVSRDEAALGSLVRRHGPMVWGVCRRILGDHHDAEDAFQATFLVLVRRAGSIRARELLANWLYGVARQTALKARAISARRRRRERHVPDLPEPAAPTQVAQSDLRAVLDDELARLPARYRAPIVLCDLQGRTRAEAAGELGWPEGTVAGRLARGRLMLGKRLARRGVHVAAAAVGVVLSRVSQSPGFSPDLVMSTIRVIGAAAVHSAPPAIVALTEEVLRVMWLTRMKIAGIAILAIIVIGAGAAAIRVLLLDREAKAPDPPGSPAPKEPSAKPTPKAAPVKHPIGPGGFTLKEVKINDGQIDFEFDYGRRVQGISRFVVADSAGNRLWAINGSTQNGIRSITYGVPPADKTHFLRVQQQEFPEKNQKPADIRGKEVRIKVSYTHSTFLGPGQEIYETTVEVPKE
jgi:RNA polymerase sigma factor (sigma-70 family)